MLGTRRWVRDAGVAMPGVRCSGRDAGSALSRFRREFWGKFKDEFRRGMEELNKQQVRR